MLITEVSVVHVVYDDAISLNLHDARKYGGKG